MIKALDGPAAGTVLSLRRAPVFLRLVRDRAGTWDALDQLEDEPAGDEEIFAYRIVDGTWGVAFVRPGGRYELGEYRYVGEQPSQFELRDTDAWRDWAIATADPPRPYAG